MPVPPVEASTAAVAPNGHDGEGGGDFLSDSGGSPGGGHQEAVFLEEDLPAHYIGADALKNEAEKKKNEAEE